MLDAVIRSRSCVRAFLPDPVPRHLLIEILETARAAPSNFNSQRVFAQLPASKQMAPPRGGVTGPTMVRGIGWGNDPTRIQAPIPARDDWGKLQ